MKFATYYIRISRRCAIIVLFCAPILFSPGCAHNEWIRARREPASPLALRLNLFRRGGPQPTARTLQHLRRYDLVKSLEKEPANTLDDLMALQGPATQEHILAITEVAFIAGQRAQQQGRDGVALDLFGVSVAHAYRYLLAPEFDELRNPYDPQFRQASDLYNGALENMMRIVQRKGQLRPGTIHVAATETQEYEFHIECRGPWHANEVDELKFVSDFDLEGLKNHYHTFGLGVPLIAIHSGESGANPAEPYYAPGMSFPVTAFLRVLPESFHASGRRRHRCVLELHDSLRVSDVIAQGRRVPLETDLSTPLAFGLNDPVFRKANIATAGLLNPEKSQRHQGLYLLEPYDPTKTPVVMVHGLWSDLVTWMEMFNDLRGVSDIRDQYQFWFYLYPSGQPLLLTAAQFRKELSRALDVVDPHGANTALDKMVLVGHSMGGLVARLQTVESRNDYWELVSKVPLDEIETEEAALDALRQATFFEPNRRVARVITIASPHRGSAFANDATRWLGRKVINLPDVFDRTREQLLANHDVIREQGIFEIQTSIDSLSPTSPVLEVMQASPAAPWVEYHNIMGVIAEDGMLSKVAGNSDGVVTIDSAKFQDASSELVVNADHVNIHRHPRTVLEVQRILLKHLDQEILAVRRLPPLGEKSAAKNDWRSRSSLY